MADQFIRVPPDSSGKKVQTNVHWVLDYELGTIDFRVGDIVVGGTSTASGVVLEIDGDTTSGKLYLYPSSTTSFIENEDLEVDAVAYAKVNNVNSEIQTQVVSVGGANNPHNKAFVDKKGGLHIRFSEGEQQLDAFGLSRVSSPELLGQYQFIFTDGADKLTSTVVGAGSEVSHDSEASSMLIIAGQGSSARAVYSSNKYHLYQPGIAQMIYIDVVCGDTGKVGNKRSWGYFDGYDGIFFRLNESDLELVVRTSTSGSVVDTAISRSEWNGDRADGLGGPTNLSGFDLDVTKTNLYWMDFQWLGSGKTRFGVYDSNGERVVLHTRINVNSFVVPWMSTPSLPLRVESINTSSTGSTSQIRFVCASVQAEGKTLDFVNSRSVSHTAAMPLYVTIPDGYYTPLMSFRATQMFHGKINRATSLPNFLSVSVRDNPVEITLIKNPTLSNGGPTWQLISDTALESDVASQTVSSGEEISKDFVSAGEHKLLPSANFGYHGEHISLAADESYGAFYTVAVQALYPGTTAQVKVAANWVDVF